MAEETLTLKQIYEEIANLDILDIRVPIVRKGKDLVVTPEILAMFKPDSTGRLHPIMDASGRITEASAQAIANSCNDVATQATLIKDALSNQAIIKNLLVSISESFEGGINTETDSWRFQHRTMFAPIVADGAGEIPSTDFAPALAGYRTCIKITHVFSDQTKAAISMVFGTTSGLTRGIVNIDMTTVANGVAPEYGPGLLWEGSAVNEAIFVSCAAGQCGNDQLLWFIGQVWYELV